MRVDKIYTLSQRIIVKTFGRIDSQTFEKIRVLLNKLTNPSYITDDTDPFLLSTASGGAVVDQCSRIVRVQLCLAMTKKAFTKKKERAK